MNKEMPDMGSPKMPEAKNNKDEFEGFEGGINRSKDKHIITSFSGEKTLYGRKDYRGMTADQVLENLPEKLKNDFLSKFEKIKKTWQNEIEFKNFNEIVVMDQGPKSIILECDAKKERVAVYYLDGGGMTTFPRDAYGED